MRQAMVSVIAALVCIVTTPTVLESADFAGTELTPPLPATDGEAGSTTGGYRSYHVNIQESRADVRRGAGEVTRCRHPPAP